MSNLFEYKELDLDLAISILKLLGLPEPIQNSIKNSIKSVITKILK